MKAISSSKYPRSGLIRALFLMDVQPEAFSIEEAVRKALLMKNS